MWFRLIKKLRTWANKIKSRLYAIYIAYTEYTLPWYVKVLAVCVLAYALSPIDLIPDFIPILGYIDDIILLPLGIALLIKIIPKEIMAECEKKAESLSKQKLPKNYAAAAVIVLIWILIAGLIVMKILN